MTVTLPRFRSRAAYCCAVGVAVVASCTLVACTPEPSAAPDTSTVAAPTTEQSPVLDSGLPIDALPEVAEGRHGFSDCPYLDSEWVAKTNGQRMVGQGIDTRFDTPACVFWSYPEEPQVTVIVRNMQSISSATDVVDWAAPIADTEPVEDNGWSGGRRGHADGSVYAVQKDKVAVIVWSNQDQSLKAELIAQEAIKNLGL
ncbi:DUF2020 domain-containing protein [Corynebacterium felinum]|uniref:UPF0176 protein n=1 Tax=Corynebacterium felinum TaxID=131318 RepID=A0ABU2B7X9_9CORY|nr:DUF2020 domain-containing protein [Corynebacterium felinum]MDF5820554.1 DUF2020 domain-containing protein [Corynebacterium felinum]MDR7354134.1 UPF0176 protein [Corynebacterium felinum]